MRIKISKPSDKIHKDEIRYVTKFYLSKLMKPEYIKPLQLTYLFKDIPYEGLLFSNDYDDSLTEYKILINSKMGKRRQLLAIAHELVHVKQYTTKEIHSFNMNKLIWKKTKINLDKIDYWEYPHEIEAYGRELGLYYKYLDIKKKNKIKFPLP